MVVEAHRDFIEDTKGYKKIFGEFKVFLFRNINEDDVPVTYSFNFPNNILSKPTSAENIINKKVLLRFFEGDEFVSDNNFIQDVDNASDAFDFFNSGKLDSVKYEELHDVIIKSLEINGIDLYNPYVIYQIQAAEGARSKKNPELPHRLDLNNPYTMVGTRDQVLLTSGVFASIVFEDVDTAFTTAVLNTVTGKKSPKSVLYKTVDM
jgi:hypothetical protein